MKILLINNEYQQFGSTEAVVRTEKQLLEANGHEVLLYRRNNNEISELSLGRKVILPFTTVYSLRTQRDIDQITRQFQPDVAYVHNFLPLVSPSVYHTLHRAGVPTIQALHEFRFLCPNSHFYVRGKICERCKNGNYLQAVRFKCYKDSRFVSLACAAALGINRLAGLLDKISGFICLTEFTRQKFMEVGVPADKLFVKPHSIDITGIQPQFETGDYILFIGRLSEEKGLVTLVQTMEELKDIRLKIVGNGPIEPQLRRLVAERGITNVDFVGLKTGSEKWELIRNSALVVVPSEWYETFCLVVIESYAAGKAVVGSHIGSLPYVIDDGNSGLLFRPGCVEDLREKLRYLLNRPREAERMGRFGRTLAETKYHPKENYHSLARIFQTVSRKKLPVRCVDEH